VTFKLSEHREERGGGERGQKRNQKINHLEGNKIGLYTHHSAAGRIIKETHKALKRQREG